MLMDTLIAAAGDLDRNLRGYVHVLAFVCEQLFVGIHTHFKGLCVCILHLYVILYVSVTLRAVCLYLSMVREYSQLQIGWHSILRLFLKTFV